MEGHCTSIRRWGSGKKVLLVHGWSSNGYWYASLIRKLLAEGYQVIAPDLPGHGLSKSKAANLFIFRNAIEQVIKKEEPSVVIGHSLGGLALFMAMKRLRNEFSAMMLLGCPYDLNRILEHFVEQIHGNPSMISHMKRRISRMFPNEEFFSPETLMSGYFGPPFQIFHDDDDREAPLEFAKKMGISAEVTLTVSNGLGHSGYMKDEGFMKKLIEQINQGVDRLDISFGRFASGTFKARPR